MNQPWIKNARFDSLLITGPAFLGIAAALIWQNFNHEQSATPPWAWFLLVVGIDVAHVYSTLFKTYLRPSEFFARKQLFLAIPGIILILGVMLYSVSSTLFWSVLAYVAVFHFIRQQYGFLILYSRRQTSSTPFEQLIDKITIYTATLAPVAWWHTSSQREFNWLIKGDFLTAPSPAFAAGCLVVLGTVLAIWLIKEAWIYRRDHFFNIPKFLIVTGTASSWYLGIVHLNSDIVFTITNVTAHGIPYIALVWLTEKQNEKPSSAKIEIFIEHGTAAIETKKGQHHLIPLAFMVPLILLMSWIEEGLWDGLVFKEYSQFFPGLDLLPQLTGKAILGIVIPLLALPQATHYVIDGFIWKQKKAQS